MRQTTWRAALLALIAALALAVAACGRDDEEDSGASESAGGATAPGVTETEIHLGGSYPFSGPASAYAAIALGVNARFETENAKGGVNGRRIKFTALDDGYEPQRAVTNVRRLVEQEKVFAVFNPLGTPNNLAIRDYLNQREVPQAYVATGASIFGSDFEKYPWTIGFNPSYESEAYTYVEYLKEEKPSAKVAVLYQNDDFGKEFLTAFEKAAEGSDITVVAQESYEVTDPTITSQMRKLGSSGADVFLNVTTPKFGAQATAAIAKGDWKPLHIINNVSANKTLVLTPVGLENAKGAVSANYFKDPEDPQWESDAAMQEYKTNLKKYEPKANPNESFSTYGWLAADVMIQALKDTPELTRENLMETIRSMDAELGLLLPGVKVTTSGDDPYPVQAWNMMEFSGERWVLQGDVIDASSSAEQ
jgi:branched-chain amino acid transport system substrate-binding protein